MVPVGSPSVFDTFSVCLRARVFQELTEEGIPFLILFHVKEDGESLEKFQHEVARQLISEKGKCVWQCSQYWYTCTSCFINSPLQQ